VVAEYGDQDQRDEHDPDRSFGPALEATLLVAAIQAKFTARHPLTPRVLAQFVSHSLPSGAVHHRPPRTHSRSSRTVPVPGARRSTVLESVLGASPREFESRILRQAPARRRASRVPRHKRQWNSGGTPVS